MLTPLGNNNKKKKNQSKSRKPVNNQIRGKKTELHKVLFSLQVISCTCLYKELIKESHLATKHKHYKHASGKRS